MDTKIDQEEIVRLKEQGWSLAQMAERYQCSKAACCKMLRRLNPPPPPPESFTDLTEKEQAFVLARVSGKSLTQCASEAYDVTTRDSAKALGWELMQRPGVEKAIQDIMQEEGMDKRYRIRKLKSHVDHRNPSISLQALDQSWKLDGSYSPEKHLIATVNYADLCKDLGELQAKRKELERELGITPLDEEEKEEWIHSKELRNDRHS